MANTKIPFIAYPSQASLRKDVQKLFTILEAGTRDSQEELASHALEAAVREVIGVMVGDLAKSLQEPGRGDGDSHRVTASLENHAGTLIRMLLKVVSNDKMLPAIRHFQTIMIEIDNQAGMPEPWVAFRIDDAYAAELKGVVAHLRDVNTPYDAERTMRMMDASIALVFRDFLDRPREQMHFGFVLRKAMESVVALLKGGIHKMVSHNMRSLREGQRKRLADHLEKLLVELPAERYG